VVDDVRFGVEAGRRFGIFLDEFHVAAGPAVARIRALLTDFVDRQLQPGDSAVVVKPLDSLLDLQLTSDHDRLRRAIASFEGRKGDYRPRTEFERDYVTGSSDRVEAVRSQIATSTLAALANGLDGAGVGRNTVIVVSEGFAAPKERRDSVLPTIDSVIRAANRGTSSIYAIHPAALGAAADPNAGASRMLRQLAESTSGLAVFAEGELRASMQRLVSDASGYYLLSMTSPAERRATFHPITIEVKRPGLDVRARSGYWSRSEDPAARALAAAWTPPAPSPPVRFRRSPLITPWFGIARANDGRLRVSFVWEAAARPSGDRVREAAPSSVAITAKTLEGALVFEGDADRSRSHALFETGPGRLRVELAIRDGDGRLLDTDVRDVIVGALAGPVEVGTPQVMRSRTAREYREIERDPGAAPVASREFSRAERLLIRVPAYGPGPGFTVTASLESRLGSSMRALPVAPGPSDGVYQIDVPLAGLATGEYRVAISAKSPAGEAGDQVDFRILP
jgi:VWFA-related protein